MVNFNTQGKIFMVKFFGYLGPLCGDMNCADSATKVATI